MKQNNAKNFVEPKYFHVSTLKFCLMTLCTFGLYEIYWAYKNWRYVRERDSKNISAVWRSILLPFWYGSLLSDISRHSDSKFIFSGVAKHFLAAAYFGWPGIFWMLPDPYSLFVLLRFLPLLPAVRAIESLNSLVSIEKQHNAHSIGNFAVYLIGGTFLVVVALSSFNFLPSLPIPAVVEGSELSESDLAFLRDEGLINDDEQILYFYSDDWFSIKDNGQFISDRYIVSYYRDPEDGELYGGYAAYKEIEELSVEWPGWTGSSEYYTVVKVTGTDQIQFELWLSPEAGGDEVFVNELRKRWKDARRDISKGLSR